MATGYDITVRDKIAGSINRKLQEITLNATTASAAIQGLQAATGLNPFGPLGNGAGRAAREVAAAETALDRFGKRFLAIEGRASKFASSLQRGFVQIRSILSGALLLGATDRIVEQIDAFAKVQNRLRTVTTSDAQRGATSEEIFRIADSARAPVLDVAESYTRFDRAIAGVGGSQKETLRLTETVSKALTMSGASATEAGAAMLQLSQAFNKGKLDGDEFRSVAELMPSALDAVSKTLGISRSQIYNYSREGKITSDVLRKAFASMADDIDKKFSSLPRTIGQGFTQLTNDVVKFFGEIDAKYQITQKIVGFFDYLRDNLPNIAQFLKAAALGFAALALPALVATLGPFIAFFGTLPTLIGLAVGYLVYFGEEIKVTADGLVTFNDMLDTAFSTIYEFATQDLGLDKLFGDNAQSSANNIALIFTNLKDVVIGVSATVVALGESIGAIFFSGQTFDGNSFGFQLLVEAWTGFEDLVTSGFVAILEVGLNVFTGIGNFFVEIFNSSILPAIDTLRSALAEILGYLDSFSLSASFTKTIKDLKTPIPKASGVPDLGFQDFLDASKPGQRENPAFNELGKVYQDSFNGTVQFMDGKVNDFYNSWIEKARANADARRQIEATLLQQQNAGDGALRPEDLEKQKALAFEAELLRANEALDRLIQKGGYMKKLLGTDFYTDEFKLREINDRGLLQGQGFSQETIKAALGMDDVKVKTDGARQAMDALKTSADATASSVGNIASSASGLQQVQTAADTSSQNIAGMANSFDTAKSAGQSFMSDMQAGLTALNDQINQFHQQASQGLQEIAGGAIQAFDKDGKFDVKKFLGSALPGAAKFFLGKYNEGRADKMQSAIKAGAPQSQNQQFGGSIFDIGDKAKDSIPFLGQMNQSIQGITNSLTQNSKVPPNIFSTLSPDANAAGAQGQGVNTSTQDVTSSVQSLSALGPVIQSLTTSLGALPQAFQAISTAAESASSGASTSLSSIGTAAATAASSVSSSFESAFQSAGAAASSFAQGAIADMQAVEAAAQSASAAISSVDSSGGGGGGGGGGFFGGFGGFASGGYTGNIGVNSVAGFVHGQEFVMPASATARYRPMLEAMRNGSPIGVPTGGSGVNISVENYGTNVEVMQLSPNDVRIIARQESKRIVQRETGSVVSASLSNPNSRVSKSLANNTQTVRRR